MNPHPPDRRQRVGWAFVWQVPGAALPFLVAYLVDVIFPSNPDLQFRGVLAVGAIPALICVGYSFFMARDSEEYIAARQGQCDTLVTQNCIL